MGFLDNLFGASDNTTTTKVEFPQWVEDASKANYGVAADIASRPYTAYPWERIAGFTGDQKDAMGFLRDMAPGVFKGAGKFDVPRMIDPIGKGGSVEKYMNPYVDNVLDRTSARIREATDAARQFSSNNTAHAAGAFGDARHGIADALIEEKGIQQMGDAAAQGYAAAYDNAQSMRNTDINRMYQTEAVNQKQMDDVMAYIDALYRSGSNQQAMDQSDMDLAYQDFMRQLNYPIEQYNLLTAGLKQSPYGSSTSNTQPGPSVAAQGLGVLGNIFSLFQ